MPSNHWQGSNERNDHKGNYYIREGIEFDENDASIISSAVTNAVAIRVATGKSVGFDDVKRIIESAKFAHTTTMKNLEWQNSKVRDTNIRRDGASSRTGRSASGADDYDDEIGF